MPSDGKFSEELLPRLKESLKRLDSLRLLSREEAASVNKLKKQIRATIAKIESQ